MVTWVKIFQIFPVMPQTSASADVYLALSRSPSAIFLVYASRRLRLTSLLTAGSVKFSLLAGQ